MPLPVQSFRARPEHRGLLVSVVKMLNEGRAGDVERFVEASEGRGVGPFRSEASAIRFLRDRLVFALKPDAIWLFGSRARGDARPESDFDLLVVLPDGRPEDEYTHEHVAHPVVACGLGCDIVPCQWGDLQKDLKTPGSIGHRAVTEGRLLYRRRNFEFPVEIVDVR
jgi:hypothetical protein